MLLLMPTPSYSSKSYGQLTFFNVEELYQSYLNDLNELDRLVNELKAQQCFYANEAEEFIKHLRLMISTQSLNKSQNKMISELVLTTKEMLSFSPITPDKREISPAFEKCARQFETQLNDVKRYKNGQIALGVGMALLTAMVIAAMITLCVLSKGLAMMVYVPIAMSLAAVKPVVFGSFAFSNAHKTHGLFAKMKPLADAIKLPEPEVEPKNGFYTLVSRH